MPRLPLSLVTLVCCTLQYLQVAHDNMSTTYCSLTSVCAFPHDIMLYLIVDISFSRLAISELNENNRYTYLGPRETSKKMHISCEESHEPGVECMKLRHVKQSRTDSHHKPRAELEALETIPTDRYLNSCHIMSVEREKLGTLCPRTLYSHERNTARNTNLTSIHS